jgi:hypothetical protein
MNQVIEILPEKHVRISESLLGIGALVLEIIKGGSRNIDSIWSSLRQKESIREKVNGTVTFDSLILSIDGLFAMGFVELDEEGRLRLCA